MVVWFFRHITENQRQLRFHVTLRTVGQKNKWTVGQKGRKGGKDSFSPEEKKLWVVRLQPSSSKFGLLIKHLTFSCNIMCDNLFKYNSGSTPSHTIPKMVIDNQPPGTFLQSPM